MSGIPTGKWAALAWYIKGVVFRVRFEGCCFRRARD